MHTRTCSRHTPCSQACGGNSLQADATSAPITAQRAHHVARHAPVGAVSLLQGGWHIPRHAEPWPQSTSTRLSPAGVAPNTSAMPSGQYTRMKRVLGSSLGTTCGCGNVATAGKGQRWLDGGCGAVQLGSATAGCSRASAAANSILQAPALRVLHRQGKPPPLLPLTMRMEYCGSAACRSASSAGQSGCHTATSTCGASRRAR